MVTATAAAQMHPIYRPTQKLLPPPFDAAVRLIPLDCLREKRFWRYALLPLVGSLVHVGLVLAWNGFTDGLVVAPVAGALARSLPVLLLVRALDRGAEGPFRLRVWWPGLVLSGGSFLGTLTTRHFPWPWEPVETRVVRHVLLLAAVLAGVAAAVPCRELLRRLAARMRLAALTAVGLLPHYYDWLEPYLWVPARPVLVAGVGALCSWFEWPVTDGTYSHPVFGPSALLRSERWEVSVAAGCLTGNLQALFVAFFASMLLSRVDRLRSPVAVAAGLLGGVAALNAINAARLAALVVVASEKIQRQGRTDVVLKAIDQFHYDGGMQMYYIFVTLTPAYLMWVSRVLDRRHRRSDKGDSP